MRVGSPIGRFALAVGVLSVFAGCGPPTAGLCKPASTLTYANFGQNFMVSYCEACHSNRWAAKGINLSSQALVAQHAAVVYQVAAARSTMPPMPQTDSFTPTGAERAQLGEWLACGAP